MRPIGFVARTIVMKAERAWFLDHRERRLRVRGREISSLGTRNDHYPFISSVGKELAMAPYLAFSSGIAYNKLNLRLRRTI